MIFGPCLVNLVTNDLINSTYYKVFIKIVEGFKGVMIGSKIIFSDIKK